MPVMMIAQDLTHEGSRHEKSSKVVNGGGGREGGGGGGGGRGRGGGGGATEVVQEDVGQHLSPKERLPPRPQLKRKKSPSPFPSSSAYPSLRRLALKNRTHAAHVPQLTSPHAQGEMSFHPTDSPLYGGGQVKINFELGSPPPEEEDEVFLVFEGTNRRHVTSAKRHSYQAYSAIIPGHDCFEAVGLTVCSLPSGCTTTELRALFDGNFIYGPDSSFYLTQFLISSVWDPDALDNPARIKGENFNLCEENFANLDERLTCAFKHIERPPSWKVITDSPRIDQNPPPRETLLHFAARFGLGGLAEHLLDQPACDVALKLPNKDGDLAVELARGAGLDRLADRMLEQSLNEESGQRSRRLDHVEGKACVIKRHQDLGTATITTKLDESNNTIEDDIQMLRDVVSYMEADEEDSPRNMSPRRAGKQTRFGHVSPDQGLSESSCSEDEDEDDEDDYIRTSREYRGRLEPVLEDSIQQIQTINHHVQTLRKENRIRLSEGARRESLSRFSTSCPLLTEDKPEVEGWKQKMPSHPGAVNHSDDDDDDDDLDDLGRGSSITSPLSPKTPPIQIQVNDISLDSSGGSGVGEGGGITAGGGAVIIPTIPSHHVVIPLAPIATTPEDASSPEDLEGDGDGDADLENGGRDLGMKDREGDKEKTRRYSWGPEPDDSLRVEATDASGSLSAASRSKSLMNLDATGQDNYAGKKDQRRGSQAQSRRDSSAAIQGQSGGYGLEGSLGGDSAHSASSSSSQSAGASSHISSVVRRQKRNLSTEQRQHRSASMYDTRLSSENDESGGSSTLSAERRRQARLSLTEFLADPRNFTDDSTRQSNSQMDPGKTSVLRKLSFLKGGPRREKKKEKEKDKEKEKEEKKKEKETEKEKVKEGFKQHNFVNSSFSNSTKCNYCEKPLQNKAALHCQICYANVHNSSCKDNIAPCTRLTKHPKSLSKVTGNAMRDKLIKGSGGLGYSQSMREKTRPNTIINATKPFQQMPFQQQGSSSDVRSPFGSAGTIDENEENDGGLGSPPKTGLGNNNINFSVESLDEMGTSEALDYVDDEDLVTQGPEPESWSVTAEKKTLKKMSSKEIKRQDVIFEFIKTEKHHLRTLKIMQKIFSYGMQNELHMDQNLIKKVFPMLDELVDIASRFYDRLQKRQKEAEVIERIGDILLDQFDGANGDRMMVAYGCLCSQQTEAKAVYKDLNKTDKRFQAFIKKCGTNALCRRWTIPECILSVSSRLTKYQLLIEAIIKPTKAIKATDKVDTQDLTKALELVKGICHSVNMQVREQERWNRLVEIYNKIEARSTGMLKGSKKFKKSDLLQNRKLRYEGELYWKNARAKLTEVHGVLLTDVLVLLTDNNGKYTFASQDNKPPVIPLFKLMVRDVAIDTKSVYLISQNKAGPEMYEVMCASEHARSEWKKMLLEAIEECPPEDYGVVPDIDTNEEEKKAAEARALRMKKLLEMMHDKDRQLNSIISEKMNLMGELKDLIIKEDALGSLKIPLISEQEIQLTQTRDIILAAMKEGAASKKRLAVIPAEATTRSSSFPNLMGTASEHLAAFNASNDGGNEEGDPPHPYQVGEPEDGGTPPPMDMVSPLPSPAHRPTRDMSLPVGRNRNSDTSRRRAFTLTGGVDVSLAIAEKEKPDLPEGPVPADLVEKIAENPPPVEQVDAATQILEHLNSLLKITAHQDTAFQTLKTQLLEAQRKLEQVNAQSPSSSSSTTASTQSPREIRRRRSPPTIRTPPSHRSAFSPTTTEPAGQAAPSPTPNSYPSTTTTTTPPHLPASDRIAEIIAGDRGKANGEKPGRSTPPPLSVRVSNAQPRGSIDSNRADHNLTRIAYGDMMPSSNHLYLQNEAERAREMGRKNSAPSPRLQEKVNAFNASQQSPNSSPRRTGDHHDGEKTGLTSAVSTSSLVRRSVVPQHLLSTTNQLQMAGQVRQQLPMKLSKSVAGMGGAPPGSGAPVQQMLPKMLESLTTSGKANKNSNAQPQPASDSDVIFF